MRECGQRFQVTTNSIGRNLKTLTSDLSSYSRIKVIVSDK